MLVREVAMQRTKEEITEEINHVRPVLKNLRDRMYVLEEQKAVEGSQVRPQVVTELHDLKDEISLSEGRIEQLEELNADTNFPSNLRDQIVNIPDELRLGFFKRRVLLSTSQRSILDFMEYEG